MQCFLDRIESVWKPHPGQREFLLCEAQTKVLACGRRWGKTDACAIQVLQLLTRRGPPVRCFLVAPTLEQAKILFERILELGDRILEPEMIKPRVSPYPRLVYGQHLVVARSGNRPRSLRGFEATDIVVDEAAYVDEDLIYGVLWPMMATTSGRMILISTPNGRNAFWQLFERGEADGLHIWSRRSPTSENPLIRSGFIEAQREMMDETRFAVEYEAAFLDRKGAVFPKECVDRCLVPSFAEPARGPYRIGIDFARVLDYTAVAILSGTRDEARLVHLERMQDPDWERQIDRIEGILRAYPNSTIATDSTGPGSGPSQRLIERVRGHRIEEVVISVANKTQLVDGLRSLIQRGALQMMPDPVLLRELDCFVETPRATGPSSFGAATGHDDTVIALALATRLLPKDHGPAIHSAGRLNP
ncbi:MAG TPA: terminase family protein [Fimbriimonas sp.]